MSLCFFLNPRLRFIQFNSFLVNNRKNLKCFIVGAFSVFILIWSVDNRRVKILDSFKVFFKIWFSSSPSIFIEPADFFNNWFFEFIDLFFSAESFETWILKVILESIESWFKVISDFCFFFEIVLMFFISVKHFFQLFTLFFCEPMEFWELVIGFDKIFFVLNFEVINNFFNISSSLTCSFLRFFWRLFLFFSWLWFFRFFSFLRFLCLLFFSLFWFLFFTLIIGVSIIIFLFFSFFFLFTFFSCTFILTFFFNGYIFNNNFINLFSCPCIESYINISFFELCKVSGVSSKNQNNFRLLSEV